VNHPLQLAIVYPGDRAAREGATPQNNRFSALFAAFAEKGVQAAPAVFVHDDPAALREQLLAVDGALVWVNPIDGGHPRDRLDALLREVAKRGVFVSTHPDVILKLGTKDVLVETREMAWGSDVHRIDSVARLRGELASRLAGGAARVLKQWRGHSGIGVWRVQCVHPEGTVHPDSLVRAREAPRGSAEQVLRFEALVDRMRPYFEDGGHMVDQAWQPRMTEGMVRCYLVRDRVVGFGMQAVNALYPAPEGGAPGDGPMPSIRHYHPPDLAHLQGLKRRLEGEWVAELRHRLAIAADELPLLWDCDFLLGERREAKEERFVLCEINVSSVAPFPDSAIQPLVDASIDALRAARTGR